MHQTSSILCLLFLCKLWISCGESSSSRSEPTIPLPTTEFKLVAPFSGYFRADPDCPSNEQSPLHIETAKIYSAHAQGLESYFRNFLSTTSQESLRNDAIEKTLYGGIFEAECTASIIEECRDKYLNIGSWRIIEPSRPLTVCHKKADFKRLSFEAIGLTAAYNIERAALRFNDAKPSLKLAPVTLKIMPEFRVRKRSLQMEGQLSDGLFYATRQMSYTRDTATIIVYPESEQHPQEAAQYWESAFITSHEYGHHIEWTLRREIPTSPASSSFSVTSPSTAQFHHMTDRAFSESFADLIAFYSLDEDPTALSEFPWDFANRNPSQPIFADRVTYKHLNKDTLRKIKSPTESTPGNITFSSIHTIGALVAHGLHQIFTATLPEEDSAENDASLEKYRYALKWYEHYTSAKQTGLSQGGWNEFSPLDSLAGSIHSLFSSSSKSTQAEVCTQWKIYFSALAKPKFC